MKVSKAQTAENKRRIVEAAARLYRAEGLRGVGVADITKAAGLTHGGLYRHFDSKEALAAQACAHAFEWSPAALDASLGKGTISRDRFARAYLTPAHRANPGGGCPVAALAVDSAREGGLVAQAFAQGVDKYLSELASQAAQARGKRGVTQQDRQSALRQVIVLVGSLILARATVDADPALSDEVLAAGRSFSANGQ